MTNSVLGYTVVTAKKPFFTIYVEKVKLIDILTSGGTGLSVTRVGENAPCANYAPLSVNLSTNSVKFAIDHLVTDKLGGRYQGVLTYNGTVLGTFYFVFSKPNPVLVGG